ncbi:MAG: glycoside hydrolase family 5 protein [Ruminococcus sp.]|nr:glycoside hydrolase family 5 protein [Ruminococcus sp.]
MRKFRIPLLLTASAVFMASAMSGCSLSGSEYDDGKMRSGMTAMEYAKDMGVGINLGNTMEAYWEDKLNETSGASLIGENTPQDYEKCWGAIVTTQECIDGMRDAGFDTVRVPVYWGNMMDDDGRYKINEEYMKRVREIVDYCRKAELYVVINVHHYDAFLIQNKEKEEVLKATEKIWTQIAEEFKGYSDYLIFEGFNEALGSQPEGADLSEEEIYDYVNDMNQTFVDAVRKTGGNNKNRILIASGYWTNIDNTTKDSFIMPEDSAEDRLMVSVHYIDNVCYWTNQIGGSYWLNYSTDQCELLKEAFTSRNIPVFVGESTSIYDYERMHGSAKDMESSECLETILNMAVDYDFVPVLWDVNDNFYSRTEFKIKSESDQDVIANIAERIENEE